MKRLTVVICLVVTGLLFGVATSSVVASEYLPIAFSPDGKYLALWRTSAGEGLTTYLAAKNKDGTYLAFWSGQVQKVLIGATPKSWWKASSHLLYSSGADGSEIGWYDLLKQKKSILYKRKTTEISGNTLDVGTVFVHEYLPETDLVLCTFMGITSDIGSDDNYLYTGVAVLSSKGLQPVLTISYQSHMSESETGKYPTVIIMRDYVPKSGEWCLVVVSNPELRGVEKLDNGVYKLDLTTGQKEQIFDFLPDSLGVSQDGEKIFVVHKILTEGQLWVYGSKNKEWKIWVASPVQSPRWVGSKIAFLSETSQGISDLYLVTEDGQLQKLASGLSGGSYCFSNDGTLLAFQDAAKNVWLYNLESGKKVQLKLPR